MLDEIHSEPSDLESVMAGIAVRARAATGPLALAATGTKNAALMAMAECIEEHRSILLLANESDMSSARKAGLPASSLDRLMLNEERIASMAAGIRAIGMLADPVGDVIACWTQPNGLQIERVRTPLGVIGVIYESRPNVTADAGALCLKAGNPVILRGGSDSRNSSAAIHACLIAGLQQAGLPTDAIQIVPSTNRTAVGMMLQGLDGAINVIVPRGGRSLVERVQKDARVPVFAHLEGVCHVYVDRSAELTMAVDISLNSKMRRTGICGAAETLLVDRQVAETHLLPILEALQAAGCEIRGDAAVCQLFSPARPACPEDWKQEYLDAVISVALVDGIAGAIAHINLHSSFHTEAIVASDPKVADQFFREIDSAILLHNASTQFADGGEFGMGAEIGIATGKMHARGPVGVEQLTSFKYRVHGCGQIRT